MKKLNKIIVLSTMICIITVIFSNNSIYDNLENNIKTLVNNTLALANTGDLSSINSKGFLVDDNTIKSLEDSGITGKDYSFDATYYPYYGLLNSNEKNLYKQIYANVSNLSTIFIPIVTVNSDEVNNAIEAVYNDHPELFWLNTSYSYKYTKNGNCVQIIMKFNETADNITKSKSEFESNAQEIINEANKLNSNYAKEKYVHDTIIKLVTYDKSSSMNQSAYSALVNKKTVCAGYARAFQYIMIKLKIPTYYCVGYANGDHAWNIVKLNDGYYNVDLTWDDNTKISYSYFNLTDADFKATHTRTNASKSLPSCTATAYRKLEIKLSNTTKNSTTTNKKNNQNNKTNNNSNSNSNKDNNQNTIPNNNKIDENTNIKEDNSTNDSSQTIDNTQSNYYDPNSNIENNSQELDSIIDIYSQKNASN